MLVVVDIGIGNIGSVSKALTHIGVKHIVSNSAAEVLRASGIILPGVGSFQIASEKLHSSGLSKVLVEVVIEKKIPILGICVGMQLLADTGFEGGESKGLGFISALVDKIESKEDKIRIPHMGWNSVDYPEHGLFEGILSGSDFYFVHSYSMRLNEKVDTAYTNHGGDIIAFVHKDNVYGTQFHPEKSQDSGLKLLRNFVSLC